jgi:protein-disulfide isomerase
MGQFLILPRRPQPVRYRFLAAVCCALVLGLFRISTTSAATQSAPLPLTAFGPADAPVVLTVFSDFACEPCAYLAVVLQGVIEARPNSVRVVFRHLPAEGGRGRDAHLASLAAAEQGRFFEFYNLAFANQDRLTREDTLAMASQLGLDLERFAQSLGNPAWANVLAGDREEADANGVSETPTVLMNGVALAGPLTLETILQRIDLGDRD